MVLSDRENLTPGQNYSTVSPNLIETLDKIGGGYIQTVTDRDRVHLFVLFVLVVR